MIAKRVAILQSNYIPWRGYFRILGSVDEFVVYDVVQFTKNDWRNRNRIRTAQGLQWLTVPVKTSGRFGQSIAETEIAGPAWAEAHWKRIAQAYARAPFLSMYRTRFEEVYAACALETRLSAVNRRLLVLVAGFLGLPAVITDADACNGDTDRTGRLVEICRSAGATVYVTGPSALGYLDLPRFAAAQIEVEVMDYSSLGPYPQVHGGAFESHVSVLDVLFNAGDAARDHVLGPAPGRGA